MRSNVVIGKDISFEFDFVLRYFHPENEIYFGDIDVLLFCDDLFNFNIFFL